MNVNLELQWLSLTNICEISQFQITMAFINCIKFVTFSYQRTPLHVAASKGRDYTVKCLVKKEADKDIKDKTGVCETILLMVVKYLTLSIRILLQLSIPCYTVHPILV